MFHSLWKCVEDMPVSWTKLWCLARAVCGNSWFFTTSFWPETHFVFSLVFTQLSANRPSMSRIIYFRCLHSQCGWAAVTSRWALTTSTWPLWKILKWFNEAQLRSYKVFATRKIRQDVTQDKHTKHKYTRDIKSRNNTFSSFFSLRYSSFPFFIADSSRGKRLRCSRAPLPPLPSSSSSSAAAPPADWRVPRAFLLRYSVRA